MPEAAVRPAADQLASYYPFEFRCPECGEWGLITASQYDGQVSIDHASTPTVAGCSFHVHVDCRALPHLPAYGLEPRQSGEIGSAGQ